MVFSVPSLVLYSLNASPVAAVGGINDWRDYQGGVSKFCWYFVSKAANNSKFLIAWILGNYRLVYFSWIHSSTVSICWTCGCNVIDWIFIRNVIASYFCLLFSIETFGSLYVRSFARYEIVVRCIPDCFVTSLLNINFLYRVICTHLWRTRLC